VIWAHIRLERTDTLWTLDISGTLSFVSLPRLARVLGRIPAGVPVSIKLAVDYLDHAAIEHLRAWCTRHEGSGGTVRISPVDVLTNVPTPRRPRRLPLPQ